VPVSLDESGYWMHTRCVDYTVYTVYTRYYTVGAVNAVGKLVCL